MVTNLELLLGMLEKVEWKIREKVDANEIIEDIKGIKEFVRERPVL